MLRLDKLNQNNINQIALWFEDPDTQKYLGKKVWINEALSRIQESVGKEFRGAKVINRIGFIAYDDTTPVGYIEAEVYDKYTICIGKNTNQEPIIGTVKIRLLQQ